MNAPEHRRGWYAMLGQLGAPLGFLIAAALFGYLWTNLSREDFLDWGWRYPFFTAFAINVVALFARLRLVVTHEYERGMTAAELEPSRVEELLSAQGSTVVIGAFVPLASFALFHLVTVFPISWIHLFTNEPVADFLGVQMIGAVLAAAAMPVSSLLADRIGRHKTIGALAVLIGLFALAVPFMLAGDQAGLYAFVLIGFVLLGLSYAQAAGAVSANFPAALSLHRCRRHHRPCLADRRRARAARRARRVGAFRAGRGDGVPAVGRGLHADRAGRQPGAETQRLNNAHDQARGAAARL